MCNRMGADADAMHARMHGGADARMHGGADALCDDTSSNSDTESQVCACVCTHACVSIALDVSEV
jgi:hypothetical protein